MTYLSIFRRLTLALALTGTISAFATAHAHPTKDDAAIAASVRDLLSERLNVTPNTIGVQSFNGIVYLDGLVDTGREKWAAAAIASKAPGVTHVVNSIEENQ